MAALQTRKVGDGWTAVVLSPGRISVARVRRRTGEKPALAALESYVREGDDLEALKRLRGASRLLKERCTTLLDHGQYRLLQVEAPNVPPEEAKDALRWRVKDMVDFSIEQAGIDVLAIPAADGGAGRTPQAFVVAASHQVLRPCIQQFQEAKIPLAAIDIPELAQRNVAALLEDENRGLALLAFDDAGGRLTFTYRGELYVSRHIDVSRQELAAAGEASGLFERVLLDVQRSLDNFDRNFSFISLTRLVVAVVPGANGFIDYLKANLYQPVEPLDLSRVLDLAAVPALAEPAQQADALLVIGAALREEA